MASPVVVDAATVTGRPLDVLNLILEGLSNKAIAEKLSLAETTVKTHVQVLLRKFGVHSRAELIVTAATRAPAQCGTCVFTAEAQSLARLLAQASVLLAEISAQLPRTPARGRASRG